MEVWFRKAESFAKNCKNSTSKRCSRVRHNGQRARDVDGVLACSVATHTSAALRICGARVRRKPTSEAKPHESRFSSRQRHECEATLRASHQSANEVVRSQCCCLYGFFFPRFLPFLRSTVSLSNDWRSRSAFSRTLLVAVMRRAMVGSPSHGALACSHTFCRRCASRSVLTTEARGRR